MIVVHESGPSLGLLRFAELKHGCWYRGAETGRVYFVFAGEDDTYRLLDTSTNYECTTSCSRGRFVRIEATVHLVAPPPQPPGAAGDPSGTWPTTMPWGALTSPDQLAAALDMRAASMLLIAVGDGGGNRNHYVCPKDHRDHADWSGMVAAGIAELSVAHYPGLRGHVPDASRHVDVFRVTPRGHEVARVVRRIWKKVSP